MLVLLGLGLLGYYYYWTCRVSKRPLLVACRPLGAFLAQHCPVVAETFYPTPWCIEGRLQTILQAFLKSCPTVTYHSEVLRTPDGGQLLLDWTEEEGGSGGRGRGGPETCPIILFLPGLTGNSHHSYILHLIQSTQRCGYRAVVFNNRGCKGEELTPRTFCADNTEDLELVTGHIRRKFPHAPLMAVGVSLGGILLLNYLSQKGTEAGLVAAMTCSAIWDLHEAISSLEGPLNQVLFNQHLAASLHQLIWRHRKVLAKYLDVEPILKARTIREIDELYTAVAFGYCSCEEYYRVTSPSWKVGMIRVPVLCLNASDDPFSPWHTIPTEAAERVPSLALLVTARGGHIGFLEGLLPRHQSYMDRVVAQFARAVFEHQEELEAAVATPGGPVA